MRRFLHVWGPDIVGLVLATSFGMGAVATGLAAHWILFVPMLTGAVVAGCATFVDAVEGNPSTRATKVACSACYVKELKLAEVQKQLGETTTALVALRKDGWQ